MMRPLSSGPWRKSLRREMKGIRTGRRPTHRAAINPPIPGSSWTRRHPQPFLAWMKLVRDQEGMVG